MPIGACCARKEVAEALGSGTHGSTYGGSPIACASALASISEILDRHLSENAEEVGAYLMEQLRTLPHVKEVRGRGLLVGVEYDIPIAMEVKWGTFKRHALITAIGDSINRMIPPLIATKKDVDLLVERMRGAAWRRQLRCRQPRAADKKELSESSPELFFCLAGLKGSCNDL